MAPKHSKMREEEGAMPRVHLHSLLCLILFVSQMWRAAGATEKVRSARITEPAAEEPVQHMQKEMKEQETLIKGYQQVRQQVI